ncbi:MAG: MBOAT family protein [Lachnospiraceae bacterium]|nr:MBOAT family protein [Lachnospiraceae bacterium]
MIFSSLLFIFWFMPVFFILYYLVPMRYKNAVLFAGSIVFYGWGEPRYLILLAVSILVNYSAGLLIHRFRSSGEASGGGKFRKDRTVLICALVFDIGMLFFFKYINFFIENINMAVGTALPKVNITLPLGISFYTFQIMSYVRDLYRGKVKVERSFIDLGTYLCMFPQLIAGPIVVYSDVAAALKNRIISMEGAEEGLTMFILGLGSKVLIANNAGALWKELETIGYSKLSMPMAWLGMLAYTIQIYFDFNGYSMMAIGLGRMLGFEFPKNFNLPYISLSITEYWRRWHMTLSGWFRDYLYIPLGGNRRGPVRKVFNLFVVWFITGFWHGADWNFILWGLYFFVLLMIERAGFGRILETNKVIARIYSLLAIGFGWMLFAISDLKQLGIYISRLFVGGVSSEILYYLRTYGVILLIGCILSSGLGNRLYERIREKKAVTVPMLTAVFVLCIAYLADASYNPFLYFRF